MDFFYSFINETVILNANPDYDIPIYFYFVYANRLFAENPQNFLQNDSGKLFEYFLKILNASSLKKAINIRLNLLRIKAYALVSTKGILALDQVNFL